MQISLKRLWKLRLLYSIATFAIVFTVLFFAVDLIWFREDDLGTILNGIIRSWHDFVRVFSADCRSFITPCNYQRSAPNVVSGFLRPMQNVFYSITYYFYGADPLAYYFVHCAIHAANATIFFLLCSIWVPPLVSFIGGLVFAFYPDVSWLAWAATLQNSLATFFMLICLLLCYVFVQRNRAYIKQAFAVPHALSDQATSTVIPVLQQQATWIGILSGVAFFFSLLSRETVLLLPLWFFIGAYFFYAPMWLPWRRRFGIAFSFSWIFLLADGLYFLMRLWVFGIETLSRTVHNVMLKYSWLVSWCCGGTPVQTQAIATDTVSSAVQIVVDPLAVVTPIASGVYLWIKHIVHALYDRFLWWFGAIFNIGFDSPRTFAVALVVLGCTFIFLLFAYKDRKHFLLWLLFGLACVMWPGVLTYPCPRYLNLMYPFIVFILIFGIFRAHKMESSTWCLRFCSLLILAGLMYLGVRGMVSNRSAVRGVAASRWDYKKRFDDFFAQYSFNPAARFIIVSSPFESDIKNIFQAYLGRFDVEVVFDPFATLAQKGFMGCPGDYQTEGVRSEITPITGGFRLKSLDPEHCGWWLRHSDYPIAWVPKNRSYEWTGEQYQTNRWYDCSVGKFKIDQMVSNDCVTDISFVYDAQWVDLNTVFVAWDTMVGRYYVIGE
jgi:hypothetical protein